MDEVVYSRQEKQNHKDFVKAFLLFIFGEFLIVTLYIWLMILGWLIVVFAFLWAFWIGYNHGWELRRQWEKESYEERRKKEKWE